jgi:N-acetylmuramoyl-L-alanine amidase
MQKNGVLQNRRFLVTIESHSPRAVTETRLFILKAATALLLSAASGVSQTPVPAQASASQAQPASPMLPKQLPSFYRNLIVIDPAHGGSDGGAQLADGAVEKDVTLAFAQRLRPLLVAQGFTVVSTRDSDPADVLAADQRAGTANHTRPLACLLLHAAASGSGVHVATSSLEPAGDGPPRVLRWNNAQAGTLAVSLRLANEVGLALSNAHLPVVLLRASVPPIDSLTCAAVVLEIAPLTPAEGSRLAVTDAAYQQRVAEATAQGLASFRTHNAPAPSALPPSPPPPAAVGRPALPAAPASTPAPGSPPTGPAAVAPRAKTPSTPARPEGAASSTQPAAKQGAPR